MPAIIERGKFMASGSERGGGGGRSSGKLSKAKKRRVSKRVSGARSRGVKTTRASDLYPDIPF